MADAPTSGVETPSRFMMDPAASTEDDEKFDQALRDAFGVDTDTTEATEPDTTVPETKVDDTEPTPGASGEGDEGQGGEEGQTPSEAIGGDAADFASLFQSRYNRPPSADEIEGYLQLAEWAAGLTPEQQQAINNAWMNPQAYTQPVDNQPTTQPTADTTPDSLAEEFGEDHPLIQRIRQLEANQQQFSQITAEQAHRQSVAKIESGSKVFQTKYNLSDEELFTLQGAVAGSGQFPAFVQASGDPEIAIQQAMDYQYWTMPQFRKREIDRELEKAKTQQEQAATRKAKASSVSGTGGNGADRTAPPPKTNDDRWAAVTNGIREAMNNGQQS